MKFNKAKKRILINPAVKEEYDRLKMEYRIKAHEQGMDSITDDEIDAEIKAYRAEKRFNKNGKV